MATHLVGDCEIDSTSTKLYPLSPKSTQRDLSEYDELCIASLNKPLRKSSKEVWVNVPNSKRTIEDDVPVTFPENEETQQLYSQLRVYQKLSNKREEQLQQLEMLKQKQKGQEELTKAQFELLQQKESQLEELKELLLSMPQPTYPLTNDLKLDKYNSYVLSQNKPKTIEKSDLPQPQKMALGNQNELAELIQRLHLSSVNSEKESCNQSQLDDRKKNLYKRIALLQNEKEERGSVSSARSSYNNETAQPNFPIKTAFPYNERENGAENMHSVKEEGF